MRIDETKIAYCKKLYLEQNGRYHYQIERSMREVGYSFSRRCLYRNSGRPGWIEKYDWKSELPELAIPVSPEISTNKLPVSSHSFEDWLKSVSPGLNWDWSYQKLVYKKLDDITSGKTKRLMIFMPP